jgi:hypothetical protein
MVLPEKVRHILSGGRRPLNARGLERTPPSYARGADESGAALGNTLLRTFQSGNRGGFMHAVVVRVSITEEGAAVAALRDEVVPQVSQAPGFVAGYWTRKDNAGLSMIVFESEDAARAASERIPGTVPDGVTLEDVDVREVVAHA